MKYGYLVLLMVFPFFSEAQAEKGGLVAGVQLYQNIVQPDGYQGLGVSANIRLDIDKGLGVVGSYMFEANDLSNAGSLKRFQRGLAVNYIPLYKNKLSPWVQLGTVFNTVDVQPVSYLFADNINTKITQNYFSLNVGIGGLYKINHELAITTGFYFQPQNYRPNYKLDISSEGSVLETNIVSINPKVAPLVYFNIGFTYKIAKLW